MFALTFIVILSTRPNFQSCYCYLSYFALPACLASCTARAQLEHIKHRPSDRPTIQCDSFDPDRRPTGCGWCFSPKNYYPRLFPLPSMGSQCRHHHLQWRSCSSFLNSFWTIQMERFSAQLSLPFTEYSFLWRWELGISCTTGGSILFPSSIHYFGINSTP